MSLFAIADTHLSIGGDKPMDIFGAHWENSVEKLRAGWESTVGADDTVVIAGDFSWGMTVQEAIEDFAFINSLPGRKIISKGNHDYWWSTLTKLNAFTAANGFDTISFMYNNAYAAGPLAVCGTRGWNIFGTGAQDVKLQLREAQRFELSCACGAGLSENVVAFMHFPPVSDRLCDRGLIDIMHKHSISRCFYGHLHRSGLSRAFTGVADGIEFNLISADVLSFTPMLVEKY